MSSSNEVNPTCNYAGLSDQLNIGKINEMVSNTSTRANKALDEYQKQLDAKNEEAKKKLADSSYTASKYRNIANQKLRELIDKQHELMSRLTTVYDSYQTQIKGTKSINELNKQRVLQHTKLEKAVDDNMGAVTTYDRKAHYEFDQYSTISMVESLFVDNFWIFMVMLFVAVYYRYKMSNKKYYAYLVALALGPILVKYVFIGTIIYLYNTFKNAYFDI
jgi:uncharacterized phage infection (PIP) family protein YhgE